MFERAFYGLIYRFGNPRWDTGITPPELVAAVEGPAALPPGRALDLGCGTGTNAVYLARHGWDATGVDFIPAAIARARRRAATAGVDVRFLAGDVTRLGDLGVTGPFDLVVDIGCFHGIPVARRAAYAQGVSAVTHAGSVLLMFAFAQGRRGRLRNFPGAPQAEIVTTLADFDLAEVQQGMESGPGEVRRPAWYRLVRR